MVVAHEPVQAIRSVGRGAQEGPRRTTHLHSIETGRTVGHGVGECACGVQRLRFLFAGVGCRGDYVRVLDRRIRTLARCVAQNFPRGATLGQPRVSTRRANEPLGNTDRVSRGGLVREAREVAPGCARGLYKRHE